MFISPLRYMIKNRCLVSAKEIIVRFSELLFDLTLINSNNGFVEVAKRWFWVGERHLKIDI